MTRKNCFLKIINEEFLSHVAGASTAKLRAKKKRKVISTQDILQFIYFLVDICANRRESFETFLYDEDRRGITTTKYKRVRSHLSFNKNELFKIFNDSLKQSVVV